MTRTNLVQIMMFPKDGTMTQFMEMASESLGIKAKRAFLDVGDKLYPVREYFIPCAYYLRETP